jgi:sugar/nucleoside kinase (ribokinase family)/nucleoside 2-deoxyribosyltransferase
MFMTEDAVFQPLDLIVVGEAPLDLILDTRPPTKRPGGVMYSAATAAARGAKVGVICEVGKDEIGGMLAAVQAASIDTEGMQQVDTRGLRYIIRNADEVVPQIITAHGQRSPSHQYALPQEYAKTHSLLLYPYTPELLLEIITPVRTAKGRVFFDLQHDIDDLKDWEQIISQCDVVFASRKELLAYTGAKTDVDAVNCLRQFGAGVVVVKYGLGGSAIYVEGQERILVPAYLAGFKCTIGAGDVYNAVFALEYTQGTGLEEAGSRAAIAATVFSEHIEFEDYTQALSKLDFAMEMRRRIPVIAHPEQLGQIQVYLAGHFLSTPMRMWVDRVTLALESRGFSVFSPYRDAGILHSTAEVSERHTCFENDVNELGNSQVVVALLDGLGRGGTSWEIGYAYAKGIPVFGLCTDTTKPMSNMVEQSCVAIKPTIAGLLSKLPRRKRRGFGRRSARLTVKATCFVQCLQILGTRCTA